MNTQSTTIDLGLAESGLDRGCRDCGHAEGGGGCGCRDGCGGSCGCGDATLERPRWFTGQLVGPGDLDALQQWVLGRARRHNRMVHGWGVSCGLAVSTVSTQGLEPVPWSVTVSPGFAISGCGDDISIPSEVRIDIRQPRPTGADVCAPPVDPWCAPVRQRRDPDRTYYLAVRYAEEQRRPVRGSACGCGCDDEPCEYSRIAETYALAILDELPDCYADGAQGEKEPNRASVDERSGIRCTPLIRELGTRPCPDCCSPWVVLADLTVSSAGVVTVDQLAHRRFLAQLGELAFTCAPSLERPKIGYTDVEKESLSRLFAENERAVLDIDVRDAVLTAPALALRGARVSKVVKSVLGSMSVAELAGADVGRLRQAVAAGDGDPDAVQRVVEAARVAVRLAQG
ncbi:hypothetical protein [Microbacterium terricola]|uniref:Uncharacterized protein n=1 Tax=Microbacterium terricola TaxID=344163 RepID=A0ABM8E0S2_9MICO|nr:hypothetical protein [Microbacterium terricola]UYK40726.1 hypothetical protein OAU46_03480 [Microbacterium terricola]BDV31537.1 hypothetical protein Microterr_21970 [Microbacterium terricola]